MVHCPTICIWSTRTKTRINTSFTNAGFVVGTVFVYGTFGCASRWCTIISFFAATNRRTSRISACRERTARIWFARRFYWCILYFHSGTSNESISFVAWITGTVRAVMVYSTLCIFSTNTDTRVDTFLFDAGLVKWTFRADQTFWPAVRWITNILWLTSTYSLVVDCITCTVWATW